MIYVQLTLMIFALISVGAFLYSLGNVHGFGAGLKTGEALGKKRRDLELRRMQEDVERTDAGEPPIDT